MTRVLLAANNAEVGGGEVMLLATAEVLRDLGVETAVAGPVLAEGATGGVVDQAEQRGFPVLRLPAQRRAAMAALRSAARGSEDWLWCHGLAPALATAGRQRRVVHVHQAPSATHRAAIGVSRLRAEAVLVPSHAMTAAVPGATVVPNWTDALPVRDADGAPDRPVRVGFIGRHSADKGLDVLARAVERLAAAEPDGWRLVLAGDGRFVPAEQTARVDAALARVGAVTDRLGWCERADFFGAVDLAVFPSTWAEPFGLVAAEAMSAGVPLVVSDAGALPEVVGAGHPWVVPAGDDAALAAVVRACATAPPEVRRAATAAARERWQEHYSPAAGRAHVAHLLRRLGIGTSAP
ncbi:glycosyltransferase [Phycicoccus flavus]|uniref:glycosyltransferase n=1 Tax=Phycicoccus flavus TaxID=2502783 RepID=UPI000FEBBED6|nr:glycosyltransferase [Phycicoccus flavus]NHA68787.1 glycosyltransferase family 4 protein [Phycicoccus flavus]